MTRKWKRAERIIRRRLGETEHHTNCNSRKGKSCDCYARANVEAHAALDQIIESATALVAALEPFNIDVPTGKENEMFEVTCGGWHLEAVRATLKGVR